jgi:hypothetical protein
MVYARDTDNTVIPQAIEGLRDLAKQERQRQSQ